MLRPTWPKSAHVNASSRRNGRRSRVELHFTNRNVDGFIPNCDCISRLEDGRSEEDGPSKDGHAHVHGWRRTKDDVPTRQACSRRKGRTAKFGMRKTSAVCRTQGSGMCVEGVCNCGWTNVGFSISLSSIETTARSFTQKDN